MRIKVWATWAATRPDANSPWNPPVNLAVLNSSERDMGFTMTPDALTLYFSSNRGKPLGELDPDFDIYRSTRPATDAEWSAPVPVAELNTVPFADKFPSVTGDDLAIGPPHLFAPMGFLDGNWWHRSYWIYGSDPVCMPPANESGWQIWPRVGNMVPAGRILSVDEKTVFGYGRDKYPGGPSGQVRGGERYHLFAAGKEASEPLPSYRDKQHLRYARSGQALGLKTTERDKRYGEPSLHRNRWSRQVLILARALVLADDTLLLAGPPEPASLRTSELILPNPDRAEATFREGHEAALCLVNAADGEPLARY